MGKEYNSNKSLIFEGEFLNDKKWNGKLDKINYFVKLEKPIYYIKGETYTIK